jgi:hypothetical protein
MARGGANRKTTRERAAELQAASAPAPVSVETPPADNGAPIDLLAQFRAVALDPKASPRQRMLALAEIERLQGGAVGSFDLQPGTTCPACGTHRDTQEEHDAKLAKLLPKLFQPSDDPRPEIEISVEDYQRWALDKHGVILHVQIEQLPEGCNSAPIPAASYVKPHPPFTAQAPSDEELAAEYPHEPPVEELIEPVQTAAERLLAIETKLERGEQLTKDEAAEYLAAKRKAS